jgi:hypothetical protein
MLNRILELFVTKTVEAGSLTLSQRIFRLTIFIAIIAIPTAICGFITSFKIVLQMWLILLAAIIPMVGGNFLIFKYFWQNQRLAFILAMSLMGFVFFELSLLGMLIDPRASNFSWGYILSVSVGIGVGITIFSTMISFLYSTIFRAARRK